MTRHDIVLKAPSKLLQFTNSYPQLQASNYDKS